MNSYRLLVGLLILVSVNLHAQTNTGTLNQLSPQEKAQGFILLFDGRSTEQWRGINKPDFPEKGWKVEDGVLSILQGDGRQGVNGGDIITKKEYGSFEFKFDFKLTEKANSGVKYFVNEAESDKSSAIGLEYQVEDDNVKSAVNTVHSLGALYELMPAKNIPEAFKKIGEWNQAIIKAYPNNRIEYWLNGYKIVEFTRGSPEFLAQVAKSKFKNRPGFGMAAKGHIVLQDHGGYVSYRNLKIRELH